MKINNKFFLGFLAMGFIAMSGCLKDGAFNDGTIQSVRTTGGLIKPVELKVSATDNTDFVNIAVQSSPDDTTIDFIPVVLATADPAPEDIHVTVDVIDSLVTNYNTANGSAYSIPDPATYTIVNPTVTIPKGSNTGYLQIKFNSNNFVTGSFAFGFRITAIQETGYTISGNFSDAVAALSIKNQYDGIYLANGVQVHPSVGGTFTNKEETFATSGANSVYLFPLNSTVTFTAVGFDIEVNSDNSLTITSPLAITPIAYDPALNFYDPATQSFHLDISYLGGSRHITMVATYEKSR